MSSTGLFAEAWRFTGRRVATTANNKCKRGTTVRGRDDARAQLARTLRCACPSQERARATAPVANRRCVCTVCKLRSR